jgi:hypothetical protein
LAEDINRFTVNSFTGNGLSLLKDCKSKQHAALQIAAQRNSTRFYRAMSLLVIGLFLFDIVAARAVQLDGLSQLLSIWPGLLLVSVGLWLCHWRPLPRLIDSCENAIWAILLTNLLSTLIQIAGRSSYPLIDAPLTQVDRYWHFNTANIAHLAAHFPPLQLVFSLTYNLIPLLIMASLLLPPFVGRAGASRRYLISLVLATFMTAALFAFWPAAGPWTTENFRPSNAQLQVTRYLAQLKSHARVTLDFESAAIVSFPSFHVVLAVLSATALSGIARIRAIGWILAGLTCISTLTTGWHYGVDLLGGFAVAGMAQLGARAISPYLEGALKKTTFANDGLQASNICPEPLRETAV